MGWISWLTGSRGAGRRLALHADIKKARLIQGGGYTASAAIATLVWGQAMLRQTMPADQQRWSAWERSVYDQAQVEVWRLTRLNQAAAREAKACRRAQRG